MEPTPENNNLLTSSDQQEEEKELSTNNKTNIEQGTKIEVEVKSEKKEREKYHNKIHNQRFSADLDLLKNNLSDKYWGLSKENKKTSANNILYTSENNYSSGALSQKFEKNSYNKISENSSSDQKNKNSENPIPQFLNLTQSLNFQSASSNAITAAYKINKSNSFKEKINSVINLKPEDILRSIFLHKKNGELSNLIMNCKEIEKLLIYLHQCKNELFKIKILEFIKHSFLESPQNIDIFNANFFEFVDEVNGNGDKKKLNLYKILFSLINDAENSFDEKGDYIYLILTVLEIMATQADCNKEIFEAVFQEFSTLYKNSKNGLVCPLKGDFLGVSIPENKEKVSLFIKKNILILKSLYSKCFYVEKPNNYFYFNGSDFLRINEKHFIEEKIFLKEGITVLFWIKPDFMNSRELNINNNLINIKSLKDFNINITIKENQILIYNLNSTNNKEEKICSHDHEFFKFKNFSNNLSNSSINSNNNNIKSINNDWIFIGVTFKKKNTKKAIIKFYINNTSNEYPSEIFDFDNEISEIQLFNKFCGYSTSFMLFEGILDDKQIELLKEDKKGSDKFYGFYSENKLTKILRKINPKHLENSDFEKLDPLIGLSDSSLDSNSNKKKDKGKNSSNDNSQNNTINNNTNYEILKEVMSKNIRIFLTPMRKNEREVFDLTNSYQANLAFYEKLNSGVCGVRTFYNFQKNIFLLGGINNILPIVELMWLSDTYKENFVYFMELISHILFEREKNMQDALEKNFFQILSIFIEKFDKEIFNASLLNIFKDLLKHFFSCIGKNNLCKIFLDNILLNVKILLKFEINLQIEIWKTLYQCYVSDPTEINKFMNIKSLSSIIVEYDKTHYFEYCCEEHRDNFIADEETNQFKSKDIMKPTLQEKIKHILMILNLMLKESDFSKNAMDLRNFKNFIKLLILDISTCLQKGIIIVLIEFFRKSTTLTRKSNEISELILEGLISNNLIDYLLFNYSISLIDVRCFILAFFKIILSYKLINCNPNKAQIKEKIIPFIFDNLFPNNLKAFKKIIIKSPTRERGLGIHSNKKHHIGVNDNLNLDNKIENDDVNKEEIENDIIVKQKKNSESGKMNFRMKLDFLNINANLEEDYISKKAYLSNENKDDILSGIEEKEDLDFVVLDYKEKNKNEEKEKAEKQEVNNENDKNENNINISEINEISVTPIDYKILEYKNPIENNQTSNSQFINNIEDNDNHLKINNNINIISFRSPVYENKIQKKNPLGNKKTNKEFLFNEQEEEMDTPTENPFSLKNSLNYGFSQNKNLNSNSNNQTPFDDKELQNKSVNINFELGEFNLNKEKEINKEDHYIENDNNKADNKIKIDMKNEEFTNEKINAEKEQEEEDSTTLSNSNIQEFDLFSKKLIDNKKCNKNNNNKKIGCYSSIKKRNTINSNESPTRRLGLDIEAINEKYQFGGDKHKLNQTEEENKKNFEEKLKMLADHCVKFMNGEVNEIKCLDFSSDIFFIEKEIEKESYPCEKEKHKNNFSEFYHTENNSNSNFLPNEPNTMRGLQKISFNFSKESNQNNESTKINEIENNNINTDTNLLPMSEVFQRNKNKKKNLIIKDLRIDIDENKDSNGLKEETRSVGISNNNEKFTSENTFNSKKIKKFKNYESENYMEIKEENEHDIEIEKETNIQENTSNYIYKELNSQKSNNKGDLTFKNFNESVPISYTQNNDLIANNQSNNENVLRKITVDSLSKEPENKKDFNITRNFGENDETENENNFAKEFIGITEKKIEVLVNNESQFTVTEKNNQNMLSDQKLAFNLDKKISDISDNKLSNNNNCDNDKNTFIIDENCSEKSFSCFVNNINANPDNETNIDPKEIERLSVIQNEAFNIDNLNSNDFEELSNFFNRDNYTKYIHIVFKCCCELMTDRDFNKNLYLFLSDKFNFTNLLYDTESYNSIENFSNFEKPSNKSITMKKTDSTILIVNPEFLNILIKITQQGNFSYIYRLLIEIQVFLHENDKLNSIILSSSDEFNSWFLELIFSCFNMHKTQKIKMREEMDSLKNINNFELARKNSYNYSSNMESSFLTEKEINNAIDNELSKKKETINSTDDLLLDTFLGELYSIFILGKKIHTKIFSDLFACQKDNPAKKINLLLNWAFNYIHIRKNKLIDDSTINEFIRNILEDIYETIKEDLTISINSLKEKGSFTNYICNNEKWENFAAYTILVYEYITFFNSLKNPKFFELDNEEVNLIPEKIILSLNLKSLKNHEDQIRKKSFEQFNNMNFHDISQYDHDHDFVVVENLKSKFAQNLNNANSNKLKDELKQINLNSQSPSNPPFTNNNLYNSNTNIDLINPNDFNLKNSEVKMEENIFEIDKTKITETYLEDESLINRNNYNTNMRKESDIIYDNETIQSNEKNKEKISNINYSITNTHVSREDFNIANEWVDYSLFLKLYQNLSKIWLETNLFLDKTDKKNQHLKDGYLINEYVLNKSNKDLFLENIKFLFYTNSWSNEFMNSNQNPKNSKSNVNHVSSENSNKINSFFHSALNKMNNPAPNYKNPNSMMSLHMKTASNNFNLSSTISFQNAINNSMNITNALNSNNVNNLMNSTINSKDIQSSVPIQNNNSDKISNFVSNNQYEKSVNILSNSISLSTALNSKELSNSKATNANNNINNNLNSFDSKINKDNLNFNNNSKFSSFNNKTIYNIYDIPLVKVINNFLIITINLSKDLKIFNYWLNEYERFLLFLIFGSSNMSKDNSEGYLFYQENILDIIIYGIMFLVKLIDELGSMKKHVFDDKTNFDNREDFVKEVCRNVFFNSSTIGNYRNDFVITLDSTLKRVFNHLIHIYIKILESTKKKKNFISNLISSKKDDLTNCAVFKLFNEIFIDGKEQKVFNDFIIDSLIDSQFIEVAKFLKNEVFNKRNIYAALIKERVDRIFDMNIYMNIIKIRINLAEKFSPVEMNQLLKPQNHSLKSLIKELKNEKSKVFGGNPTTNDNNQNTLSKKNFNQNFAFIENKEKEFLDFTTTMQNENFNEKAIMTKYEKSFSLLKHKIGALEINNPNLNNYYSNNTFNNFDAKNQKILISELNMNNNQVFEVIEKAIQVFINEIKELGSDELRESKEKKLLYKYVKKKFFSWRGLWADKELFFKKPELLKYKTLNHYTSSYSKPFLIPILDLEYHLPNFTSFNPQKLLLENNKNLDHHVCLDVGKILSFGNNNLNINPQTQTQNKNFNPSKKEDINNIINYLKNKEIINSIIIDKKTTFFFDIYKLTSKNIWKYYVEINLLHQKYKLNPEGEYFNTVTEKFLLRRNSLKKIVPDNLFDCCYVKKCHHIKGIFQVNTDGITFRLNLNKVFSQNFNNSKNNNNQDLLEFKKSNSKISIDVNEIDLHYDEQRKTCVGSYITYHKKDIDKLIRNFPYNEIKFIFKRNYYLRKSGLEIFISNQSYYFNFKSNEERDGALKEILNYLEYKKELKSDINFKHYYQNINYENTNANFFNEKDNIIGYENLAATLPNYQLNQIKKSSKIETVSNKLESWLMWKISNFEMLMWLNLLGNRSYSDISQYPIFPWVIKNYSRQINNFAEFFKELRDLRLPMGMMTVDEKGKGKERKQNYIDMFKNTKEDFEKGESFSPAYFYGHTYSNPMYVTHYLTRIFPFSQIAVELQGSGFDDPNRMFLSLENSFLCSATQKGDVRELIPEFYFMPEIFYNINNINFGERIFANNEKTIVNDVALPSWAEGQGYKLICKFKEVLESQEVSIKLCEWLDLIFGFKQRGVAAEESKNLYLPSAYGIDTSLENMEKDQRCTALTMVEIGLVPNQITNKKFPTRLSKDYVRNGKQITESNDLRIGKYTDILQSKKSGNGVRDKRMMVHMKIIDDEQNLMCVFNNNKIFMYKMVSDSVKIIENFNYQDSLFKVQNKNPDYYGKTTENSPVVIYGNGKYIACGGYWDGGIRVINLDNQSKNNVKIYSTVDFPNVCISIDKDEKYAFAGSTLGILTIFRIYEKENKWIKIKDLFDHNKDISHIFISNSLNILATACIDGFVNLYTFPNFYLIRAIKLEKNFSADYVFLSNSPLPCVCIFSKSKYSFFIYSVNGNKIYSEVAEDGMILSPQVFTDISFNDHLIYGTNKGFIRIRKFPEMTAVKKISKQKKNNKNEESQPIKCLDISSDKKTILLWSCNNPEVNIISDPNETSEAATYNLRSMGLG